MNAVRHASPAQRARALRALGIASWQRRTAMPDAAMPAAAPDADEQVGMAAEAACLVLLPAGCSTRALDLLTRALLAAGPAVARAARIEVRDGQLPALPAARACLAFGAAQLHALGRELPAERQRAMAIIAADAPEQVLTSGAGKRRLWHALRQLRRALAN